MLLLMANNDLTGRVIGCAMEVHRVLGNGFQEVIYQRALAVELELNIFNLNGNLRCLFFSKKSMLVLDALTF